MFRRLFASSLMLLFAVAMLASPVLADEPVIGNMLVLAQSVEPGDSFPVSGYDMDPGVVVSLVIHQGGEPVPAGSATVAADGTFSTMASVPAGFSNGYAELVGTGSEGGRWVASVLVGTLTAPPTPGVTPPLDARSLAVVLFFVGLAVFAVAGSVYLRGLRRSSKSPD